MIYNINNKKVDLIEECDYLFYEGESKIDIAFTIDPQGKVNRIYENSGMIWKDGEFELIEKELNERLYEEIISNKTW